LVQSDQQRDNLGLDYLKLLSIHALLSIRIVSLKYSNADYLFAYTIRSGRCATRVPACDSLHLVLTGGFRGCNCY